MRNLTSSRVIKLKVCLLFLLGILSGGALLWQTPTLQTGLFLGLTVWAFCRCYYFVFYVIERYLDSTYRFNGMLSLIRYLLRIQ